MILGVPVTDVLWLVGEIVLAGIVAGVLAGLFGIGGGVVVVPVLYEVFRVLGVPEEVRMQLCVGTSFAILVPTTARSYLAHRAKGAVLAEVLWQWAVPAVIGVGAGSWLAAIAPAAVFKTAFILFVNLLMAKLLFGRESWRLGDELPGRAAMVAYGGGIGLLSALVGVAGGSLCTMVLTLYGKPIHRAVATAAGFGVPITLAATLGYIVAGIPHEAQLPPFSLGFVSLGGFVLMAPIASITASHGARLAHALPRRRLEIAFGLFLLAVSVRFIASMIL
jgi:uncharacterized membrane protein YfcA